MQRFLLLPDNSEPDSKRYFCNSNEILDNVQYVVNSIEELYHKPSDLTNKFYSENKNYLLLVVFFLLGDSLASEFHVPKFRNNMSVPSS